ncbi:MAG: cyanophycin synthetase [Candidatus Andersenbacteria bacterium]
MMASTQKQRIGMLGVLGAGMRGLAWILWRQGNEIAGTDTQLRPEHASEGDLQGYELYPEIEFEQVLKQLDLVVHSDSVNTDHPVLRAAKQHGILIKPYQEALGEVSAQYMTIAIAGTHGKSSTTAFLAHVLTEAGLDPTVLVGAPIDGWECKHARVGQSNIFVVEADEYRNHFLALTPSHIIITSIDFDHPDYFSSLADVEASYNSFVHKLPPGGALITHAAIQSDHPSLSWPAQTIAIPPSDWDDIDVPLPGEHMRQNAGLAVTAATRIAKIPSTDARQFLRTFPGLGRRTEAIGSFRTTPVISDYGHHPEEIRTTLSGLKEKYSGERLLVIFEAHMRERLDHFLLDFAKALSRADGVIIYPPFSPVGREAQTTNPHTQKLAALLTEQGVQTHLLTAAAELSNTLTQTSSDYDRIIAFTAGALDAQLRSLVSKDLDS